MTADESAISATNFEDNLQALETLVERLEQGDIPLAEAMQAYEDGLRRARACESLLAAAQERIEKLGAENDEDPDAAT